MNDKIYSHKDLDTYDRHEIEGYADLESLALNLMWSWSHWGDKVWEQLDPDLWKMTHNPWVVLQTASTEKLEKMLSDPNYRKIVNNLVEYTKSKIEAPGWFKENYSQGPLSCVAYFCMEYMLSEALPIYSGGLGNVAGDQLKAASNLDVPVVAIGLLYQQGYFRQVIDKDGAQQAFYPYNSPGQLPITPLRAANGEWLRIEIRLPGWSLWLRTWKVQVGRATLYLLDSNDPANYPAYRTITSELYGGGPELRLKQEMILGIGGYRLLNVLGLKPEVCHLNECHAAFVVLERARKFMDETGLPFHVALEVTRAGNLFTTHTAVAAGFDRFSPNMLESHLGEYAKKKLHIPFQELLALGRENPNDSQESFNMAYLAIRGSGAINAVSCLHAKVSRHLFAPLFPRWPVNEVPVSHVTNGVHMPSWDSKESDDLWTEACGKNRWIGTVESLEANMQRISDARIWQMRNAQRKNLVEFTRDRAKRELTFLGAPQKEIEDAKTLFDPNVLTLGFARRFATYKRPNMLLHDPERLLRILNNADRPVQLIIAGKAHPADIPGQNLIKEWTNFIKRPEARGRVIFLSDYDMFLTEQLVQGVDVWVNTPRRPWEACGTSGMKVLVNGGLNLSELDGWWVEAYTPEVGWALGDGKEHGDDPSWDAIEAEKLYELLEKEIVPLFYQREKDAPPAAWLTRVRESMTRLTPRFSADRTVKEYTEKHYIPAAKAFKERAENKGTLGTQVVDWNHALEQKWPGVQFNSATISSAGKQLEFKIQANLNGLDPHGIKIELYAEGLNGNRPEYYPMLPTGNPSNCIYQVSVETERPPSDFTPRIVPYHPSVKVPLEADEILWQR